MYIMICITGPTSCGKTTTIKGLKERGFHVCDRQYARELLVKHRWTIQDVYQTPQRLLDFHQQLLDVKIETEGNKNFDFCERSPIDFYMYLYMYFEKYFPENQDLYMKVSLIFKYRCMSYHHSLYSSMIYLSETPFLEDDQIRINSQEWHAKQLTHYKYLLPKLDHVRIVTDMALSARIKQCEDEYAILRNRKK